MEWYSILSRSLLLPKIISQLLTTLWINLHSRPWIIKDLSSKEPDHKALRGRKDLRQNSKTTIQLDSKSKLGTRFPKRISHLLINETWAIWSSSANSSAKGIIQPRNNLQQGLLQLQIIHQTSSPKLFQEERALINLPSQWVGQLLATPRLKMISLCQPNNLL